MHTSSQVGHWKAEVQLYCSGRLSVIEYVGSAPARPGWRTARRTPARGGCRVLLPSSYGMAARPPPLVAPRRPLRGTHCVRVAVDDPKLT